MKGQKAYALAKQINEELYSNSGRSTEDKKELYYRYFSLIRKAAYAGHTEALYDMGQQYEDIGYLGAPNPMCNAKKAVYWYTKACKKDHPEAFNNLSSFYDFGKGCTQDLDFSLSLLKRSSELGSKLGRKNYRMLAKRLARTGSYFMKAM